jgi:hypothetical protein
VFILRAPEFYADIRSIHESFDFDLLIADVMFTALPLVKKLLDKPVIAVGVLPLVETSKDLAPAGLGMTPSTSFGGKLLHRGLRFLTDRVLFGKSHRLYRKVIADYGIDCSGNTMDFLVRNSTLFLQSGTPGFEYHRSDLGKNIRYIGALLPLMHARTTGHDIASLAREFRKVILVTQGTIEKDPQKLIIPTLEAFKDSGYLVIATTGGSHTEGLRSRYPQKNIVIADFIPFAEVLPVTDVYVTNGGYGGVMLSIEHHVPMVVAGVHEGKNEINARVGHFRLGVNLKTERPEATQILAGVQEVLENPLYKKNVLRLGNEFRQYVPMELCTHYIREAVEGTSTESEAMQGYATASPVQEPSAMALATK